MKRFLSSILIALGVSASAQIIPAGHLPGGVIWASNQVGVIGGIPNVTNIYVALNPDSRGGTNDWWNINQFLLWCPSNQVVYLNAGTYTIDANGLLFGDIWNSFFSTEGHNGVVLRGAGPGKTVMHINSPIHVSCNNMWSGAIPTSGAYLWNSGYAQGTTSITVDPGAAANGLAAGDLIMLTQENDINLVEIGGTTSPQIIFTDANGKDCNQIQWVKVVSLVNGTNLTIYPGVYMTNYQASLHPQIIWNGPLWQSTLNNSMMIGIEDMTIDGQNGWASFAVIEFDFSYNCWVRNIDFTNVPYAAVKFIHSAHGAVEDCYIHNSNTGGAAESYGVNPCMSSDILVENNIFYKITSPLLLDAGVSGCVSAYNYCTNMIYGLSPGWMSPSFNSHGAHPSMNLTEGNIGTGASFDIIHGSSSHNTVFRNYLYGYETNLNNYGSWGLNNTFPVSVMSSNRWITFIGNVLGTDTYHTNYQVDALSFPTNYWNGQAAPNLRSIYILGYYGDYGGTDSTDLMTQATLTRDGNYDYATHSTKWDDTPQTIPTSLYLAAQPSWWSNSVPFPPIGSDLTPMVSAIPAQLRFAAMGQTNVTATTSPGAEPWQLRRW
jgi:hypothetical protein